MKVGSMILSSGAACSEREMKSICDMVVELK
jgi:hypothetical protein